MKFIQAVLIVMHGLFIGGLVNSSIVAISCNVIALAPEGNLNNINSIIAHIANFKPQIIL